MEGFKVKIIGMEIIKEVPEDERESGEITETVDFESEVYKISNRMVSGEIKTDFLVYHETIGFTWIDCVLCDLMKPKRTAKSK